MDHGERIQVQFHPLKVALGDARGTLEFNFLPFSPAMSSASDELTKSRIPKIIKETMGVYDAAPLWLHLIFPRFVAQWCVGTFVNKLLESPTKLKATVTTVSDLIDEHKLKVVDILKVDVEGAEAAVLRGIRSEHWPRIRQLMIEAETFAEAKALQGTLEDKGFKCTFVASRLEAFPASGSEISMIYAVRPGSA